MKGRFLIVLLISLLAVSCGDRFSIDSNNRYKRVMILYSAGCNNLSGELTNDIADLKQGYIPKKTDNEALLIVSHMASGAYGSVETLTNSYVVRLYRKRSVVVADTLKTIEAGKFLTQPKVMNEALDFIFRLFKSESYGMVFSSHATGWIPEGYFSNPTMTSANGSTVWQAPPKSSAIHNGNIIESIGPEDAMIDGESVKIELQITDFAPYVPMHLDYLIFDACYMGGVEIAYEFRNACDVIAFAPTEVLSEGFNYKTLASHLLEKENDVYNVCKDFYDLYKDGSMGATVTLVDCKKIEGLADVCKELFEKYRSQISHINPRLVQYYFQENKHWFYDLEDILVKAGISDTERSMLNSALDDCILYKAATPRFLSIPIKTYSGFSMYLPCNGSDYLDDFYKTLAWNKATGLVQ